MVRHRQKQQPNCSPLYTFLLDTALLSCTVQNKALHSIQNTFIAKIEVQLAQGPRWGPPSGEGEMVGMCLTREAQ